MGNKKTSKRIASADKFVIESENGYVALKYYDGNVIMGGYTLRVRMFIETLLMEYFKLYKMPEWQCTQQNKGRVIFPLARAAFLQIVENLRNHRFKVLPVKSHGRLMR